MWWPLTKVNASVWSGVTVQTPSTNEIRQWRGWIEGPKSCKQFVFAEPTYNFPLKLIINTNSFIIKDFIRSSQYLQHDLCDALTSTGSWPSFKRRPPSPLWVTSTNIGPSRSCDMWLVPLAAPSGFFFRRRGCESAGRLRTWNIIEPKRREIDQRIQLKQK